MLSKIQIEILSKLLKSKKLRYSEAQIRSIDNDLYNYHLQFLVKKGYILKDAKGYKLTDKGKVFVQQIDSKGKVKKYFKVSVLPYVVRSVKNKKEILIHKRLRHPYLGDHETVAGKVNVGERIEDAAKRKLLEETGLVCDFALIGVIRKIRRNSKNNVVEDTIYHVCYGDDPEGELISKNEFGENWWGSFQEARKLLRKNITYSKTSEKVLNRVEKEETDLFYYQEDIVLKEM